jgi:hypothetical protein
VRQHDQRPPSRFSLKFGTAGPYGPPFLFQGRVALRRAIVGPDRRPRSACAHAALRPDRTKINRVGDVAAGSARRRPGVDRDSLRAGSPLRSRRRTRPSAHPCGTGGNSIGICSSDHDFRPHRDVTTLDHLSRIRDSLTCIPREQHRDLEQFRALLGHARIDTTQIYTSIRPPQLKRAVSFYEDQAMRMLIDRNER